VIAEWSEAGIPELARVPVVPGQRGHVPVEAEFANRDQPHQRSPLSTGGCHSIRRHADRLLSNLEPEGCAGVFHNSIWALDQGFQLGIPTLLGYFYLDKGLISFLQVGVLGLYNTVVVPLVAGLCLVEVTFSSQSESLQPFEEFLLGRSDEELLVSWPCIQ
jgi:hypothetical protein